MTVELPPVASGEESARGGVFGVAKTLKSLLSIFKSQMQIKKQRLTSKCENGGASVMKHSSSRLDSLQDKAGGEAAASDQEEAVSII